MDMSFMSKFLVQGRDAGRVLDYISANDVDGAAGRRSRTRSGSTRAARSRPTSPSPSSTTTASGWSPPTPRTATWRRGCAGTPGGRARLRDRRDLGLRAAQRAGPRSRELLQSVTTADLSNEAFPFRAAREIDIGFARVLCVRITYLGELGYELYIPTEQATHVYDRLVAAGERVRAAARGAEGAGEPAHGEGLPRLRPRHRQHRLVLEAGLGFAVDLKKPGGFIGKEAVLAKRPPGRCGSAWCRCWSKIRSR
jgi:glycine cleavage system aminomethyltransferase T